MTADFVRFAQFLTLFTFLTLSALSASAQQGSESSGQGAGVDLGGHLGWAEVEDAEDADDGKFLLGTHAGIRPFAQEETSGHDG